MRKAGRARIDAKLKKHGARRHAAWAGKIVSALGRQTVTVTGTETAGTVLPRPARQLIALHSQRADVAARVETLVRAHPHARGPDHPCRVSGSGPQPSSWPRPWARPPGTGAQLASYAGLTPVTRRSGSSIRGERVCRTGNKRLKHAMFLSAFASLTDPVSRTYYQRKRDQGKRLGPGPARPGPPPHPHPARHDPRRSPLRPATSHETTRSRLTHHIGAPPAPHPSSPEMAQ